MTKSTKINVDLSVMALEKSIGEETISDSDLKNIKIISDIPYLIRQTKNPKIDAEIDQEAGPKGSSCVALCPLIFKPYGCGTDQMFRFELFGDELEFSSSINELLARRIEYKSFQVSKKQYPLVPIDVAIVRI